MTVAFARRGARLLPWLLACVPLAASAQLGGPPPPDAQSVLAAAKAASGGGAWDALRSQHSKVAIRAGDVTGAAERWSEIPTGRSLIAYTIGPVAGAAGFDGTLAWSQDASGQSRVETADAARELAVNVAYRDRLAFWYPERAAARIAYKERVGADGADFDVVRITPEGGRPFELWVNTETRLIERLVEREAQDTRTEVYMDMRELSGVKVPFRVRASRSDGRRDELIVVESMAFNEPLTGVSFAQPAPPPPDFAFPAGKDFVEVPFEQHDGHLFLSVMLNGRGPFRMLLDSGGVNVLLPQTVATLGLRADGAADSGAKNVSGVARIDRLEFRGILVARQAFAVFDLDALLRRVEGLPDIAGVVGYELFRRFPVKLDFVRSRATFYNPATFRYAGSGMRLPVAFRGTRPHVRGRVDGVEGDFVVDTGSRGSLTLALPFVEANGLVAKYGAKVEVISGAGTGGHLRALLARARTFELGTIAIADPLTALSLQQAGALAGLDQAGNLGHGILRRFDLTFDYAAGALYLEKNANFGSRDVHDRAGVWIERAAMGFEVVAVVAGGPADAAGVKPGDVIIAVDGEAAAALPLAAARARLKGAPGRRIRLTIDGGAQRVVTLRDLV